MSMVVPLPLVGGAVILPMRRALICYKDKYIMMDIIMKDKAHHNIAMHTIIK